MPPPRPKGFLRTSLERIEAYYELSPLKEVEQRRLNDYKEVLEEFRKSSPLVDAACEGKTTLTQEVEHLEALTNEKYGGFFKFWKPYSALDEAYNAKIQSLETTLGIETQSMRTGRNRALAVAEYIGREIMSDALLAAVWVVCYKALTIPPKIDASPILMYVMIGAVAFSGLIFKGDMSPQFRNRNRRNKSLLLMREDAEFLEGIIEQVYKK